MVVDCIAPRHGTRWLLLFLVVCAVAVASLSSVSLPPALRTSGTPLGAAWGTNIHWTSEPQPGEAAMLSRAFRVARMDLVWGQVENVCGQYNFAAYDTLLSQMTAAGVRPYWILDYGNPCYPGTYPNSCNTDVCIAAYGRFAAAVVQHFRGHNIIFEIVNEPDGMGADNATTLLKLSQAAWPAFRDAGEIWVGPTTAGFDWIYILEVFAGGFLETVSGVSVHPYRSTPPETAISDFAALRELMVKYAPENRSGYSYPIYDGEWGYTSAELPCLYGNRVNVSTQGKYVARMWLVSLLSGAEIAISYDWHDDGADPTNCEDNFGSVMNAATGNVSEPYQPKPAYHAALTLQQTVGQADVFLGRLNATSQVFSSSDIFVLGFHHTASNGTWFAVWHNATTTHINATVSFELPLWMNLGQSTQSAPCFVVTDTFGNRWVNQSCAVDRIVSVSASDGPSYLMSA